MMKYFVVLSALIGFVGISFADESPEHLVPEPEQDILEYEQDILEYENCRPGTTYQDGICVVNEKEVNANSSGIWEPIIKYSVTAPLKQFNSGIPFNEIQCKETLVLLQKYDSSPVCVKNETKKVLVERGWAKPDIRASTE